MIFLFVIDIYICLTFAEYIATYLWNPVNKKLVFSSLALYSVRRMARLKLKQYTYIVKPASFNKAFQIISAKSTRRHKLCIYDILIIYDYIDFW